MGLESLAVVTALVGALGSVVSTVLAALRARQEQKESDEARATAELAADRFDAARGQLDLTVVGLAVL